MAAPIGASCSAPLAKPCGQHHRGDDRQHRLVAHLKQREAKNAAEQQPAHQCSRGRFQAISATSAQHGEEERRHAGFDGFHSSISGSICKW